jgi:hypothetical protein
MKNQARHAIALFAATLLTLTSSPSQAQDANLIAITKSQNFQQNQSGIPSLIDQSEEDSRFKFEVFVDPASAGRVTSASVTVPGGAMHTLQADNDTFNFGQGFGEKNDFDEAFAMGLYTVNLVGQNDGATNAMLTLPADNYPNIPRIANWGSAQNIDSTMAFPLMWDAFTGGTTNDFVMVEIQADGQLGGSMIFESARPGDGGSLNGTSTSVSIPASTLSPGGTYTASVSFFRIVASDNGYTMAVVAYQKRTKFSIKAVGGSDEQGPTLERIGPPAGTTNVKDISVVAFRFSEPMNTNVELSDAIDWTGVADPNKFSYTWSVDGTRLFCQYPPTLPLNTMVGWTLNPSVGATQFQDAAGNPLQGGQLSGSFTTAPNLTVGEKDVLRFEIHKVKSLFQEGATVTSAEVFEFGFTVELNGFNTVSSVDITPPGPGASAIRSYSDRHGDKFEGRANYAEKSDLDTLIPNGIFAITFNTFHDESPTAQPTAHLDLSTESYPNDPMLQNHAATQTMDPAAPFTLTWNAMDSPGADDAVILFIQNSFGRNIFETPNPGEPEVLPGSAVSFEIPANRLPPGRTLELGIAFVKSTDIETEDYASVRGQAFFATVTFIEITTTGDPIKAELDMERVEQGQFKFRVLGEKHFPYTVESSLDFINWTKMYSRTADENIIDFLGSFEFTEFDMSNPSRRFYRTSEGEYFNNGSGSGGN